MIMLSIDGRELSGLNITKYTPKYELLDGEASARTRAPGWDLIREPQGLIVNFAVEFFNTRTDNPDFVYFMAKHRSLGSQEFVMVTHRDPAGQLWTQQMYYVVDGVDFLRATDGGIYTEKIVARFIAKKGVANA